MHTGCIQTLYAHVALGYNQHHDIMMFVVLRSPCFYAYYAYELLLLGTLYTMHTYAY